MFEEFHITFDLSLVIFFGYASVSVRQYKELTARSVASHKRQTTFILGGTINKSYAAYGVVYKY